MALYMPERMEVRNARTLLGDPAVCVVACWPVVVFKRFDAVARYPTSYPRACGQVWWGNPVWRAASVTAQLRHVAWQIVRTLCVSRVFR